MAAVALRLGCCIFFAMAVATAVAAARNPILPSSQAGKAEIEDVIMVATHAQMGEVGGDGDADGVGEVGIRRLLNVISLNDYGEPSANRGHDPKNKGGSGGHKSRDSNDNP